MKKFFWKKLFRIYKFDYNYHNQILIKDGVPFGEMSFDEFLIEYNKREWDRNITYPASHFGVGNCHFKNYIHAGYIKINGVGVWFSYDNFIAFKQWEKENTHQTIAKSPKSKWQNLTKNNEL